MKLTKYFLELIVNDQKLHSLNKEELRVILMDFAESYHKEKIDSHFVRKDIIEEYAEFCVRCDRGMLPLVKLEDYIDIYVKK